MFEWNDAYSVKVPLIDEQHKKLFVIGQKVYNLVEERKGYDNYDRVLEAINELYDYTRYHFAEEEKLLRKYGYEDLDNHLQKHDEFLQHLDSLDIEEIDLHQDEAINGLLKFIASWIFKHINNVDFEYSDFLQASLA
jgi:hemerythrin